MYKPVEKGKRNYELVIEQLHLLIAEEKIKPGDLILPERKLAEQLNVSRTSVREALRILEALDVVFVKPGEGTFLKKPTMNGIIAPFADVFTGRYG
ncbi:FadR/GntR family transcriptional regulator [Neobacillus mesonae]|uniref:FadR/GntR family transcriptional regulator n=1 Tax=Neobacillus mesonae TaxID=1193713 RepID=UPI00203AE195|nr:GntR family transcriptional regulator [Neobacillus mesonae]MCM3569345.1 GntR family transcriptional regulator [Neobacillus mesonae]